MKNLAVLNSRKIGGDYLIEFGEKQANHFQKIDANGRFVGRMKLVHQPREEFRDVMQASRLSAHIWEDIG